MSIKHINKCIVGMPDKLKAVLDGEGQFAGYLGAHRLCQAYF